MEERALNIYFETHGCRSNFADTVDLKVLCGQDGARVVSSIELCDVYVLNTCTVTNHAERDALRVLRKVRRQYPNVRIVATGCLAEVGADKLLAEGLVDAAVGTGQTRKTSEVILGRLDDAIIRQSLGQRLGRTSGQPQGYEQGRLMSRSEARRRRSLSVIEPVAIGADASECCRPGALPSGGTAETSIASLAVKTVVSAKGVGHERARFHLRVQEGCENHCTYCIIPFTRGGLASKSIDQVVADINRLDECGYKEVVLTGTHLGGYGRDIGENLLKLLCVLDKKSKIRRIRLSSLDPNDVGKELIDFLSGSGVFCEHFHVCLQAMSDRLLKLMARRYRIGQALDILEYLRRMIPGACLGSDIITGFPGERASDFAEQQVVFGSSPLNYLHVFPYSERDNTSALRLPDVVGGAERKVRATSWREVSAKRRDDFSRAALGRKLAVIVECCDGDFFYGTSREYLAIKIRCGGSLSFGGEVSRSGISDSQDFIGREVWVQAMSYDAADNRVLCDL